MTEAMAMMHDLLSVMRDTSLLGWMRACSLDVGRLAADVTWKHYPTSLYSLSTHFKGPLPVPIGRIHPPLCFQMLVSALLELSRCAFSRFLECPHFIGLPIKCSTNDSCLYLLMISSIFLSQGTSVKHKNNNLKKNFIFPLLLFSFICIDCIYHFNFVTPLIQSHLL